MASQLDGVLAGRVALVTGGASGIGLAIARRFVEEGAVVMVADLDERATEPAAQLGAGTHAVALDVSDEADWADAVAACRERHGRLDVLVNNAGVAGSGAPQDPERIELADWHEILRVNLDGVMLGCRAAIPAMAQGGGGAIVNVSSVTGRLATPRAIAYGAAKAGVNHLTLSVALHCARRGHPIRCNAIEPGTIRTPMTEQVLSAGSDREAGVAAARKRIPVGELGEPEDIAYLATYLASDAARYLTGAIIPVDGGWSIPH